jgi:hypothetical protein
MIGIYSAVAGAAVCVNLIRGRAHRPRAAEWDSNKCRLAFTADGLRPPAPICANGFPLSMEKTACDSRTTENTTAMKVNLWIAVFACPSRHHDSLVALGIREAGLKRYRRFKRKVGSYRLAALVSGVIACPLMLCLLLNSAL